MLWVELAGGDEREFLVKVDYIPSKIKIAFTVTSDSQTPIGFEVIFPYSKKISYDYYTIVH
jgi:hypothetical protein